MCTRNQSTYFFYTHWHAFIVVHTHTHTHIAPPKRKKKQCVRLRIQQNLYNKMKRTHCDDFKSAIKMRVRFIFYFVLYIFFLYGCHFIVCMIIFNVTHLIQVFFFIEKQETEPIRMRQTTNQNQQNSRVHDMACRTAPKKNSCVYKNIH